MLFTANTTYNKLPVNDDCFVVPASGEVETFSGCESVKELVVSDVLKGEETEEIVMNIEQRLDNTYLIRTQETEFYNHPVV